MTGGLEGRCALVTGGGSGLGLACASRLRADGATVTIAGRTQDRLTAAAAHLRSIHGPGEVRWAMVDVTEDAAVERAVEVADRPHGLSIVVASAGVGWVAPIASIPVDAWRNVMDVNLTGNFLTLKHAAPRMRAAGGGAYTAISSVAGMLPTGFLSPYSTAKGGVDMFVRTAAEELGRWEIRVNSVLPGLIPTDLTTEIAADTELRDEHLDNMPIRRLGTPEDVAAVVRFLSGPEASWVTGVNLPVDGGQHLRRAARFDAYVRREHGPDWLPPPGDLTREASEPRGV